MAVRDASATSRFRARPGCGAGPYLIYVWTRRVDASRTRDHASGINHRVRVDPSSPASRRSVERPRPLASRRRRRDDGVRRAMGARARARDARRTTRAFVAILALALRAATTPAAVRATRATRRRTKDDDDDEERRDDDEGLTDGRDDAGNDAAMAKITRVGGEQARGTGTRHGADETPKRDATGRLTRRAARRRTGDERGDVRGGRAAGIRMGSERCVELTVRALIQRRTDGARVDPRQRRCRASSRAWTTPWRSPREARRTRGGAIDADSSARETL